MQMAELLVSHGASLSARTSLDEMPIGELTKLENKWLRKTIPLVLLESSRSAFRSIDTIFQVSLESKLQLL